MKDQCPVVASCDGGMNCPWHNLGGIPVEPSPTAYEIFKKDAVRKPLAFDVEASKFSATEEEDAECQANGPAMFGGTDTNPAYTMEHAWLQIQNQIKMAHDTGYAKGFHAAQVHYMKVVEEFMVTHLKPMYIVANEPAHLAEDFMTNPKRATEKPRGQM